MDKISEHTTINGLVVSIWQSGTNSYDVSVIEVGSIDAPLDLLCGVTLDHAKEFVQKFITFIEGHHGKRKA